MATKTSTRTRKTSEPKSHADNITTTVELTPRVKRTYSAPLKQHAVWVDGTIVATSHAINVFWSIVIGDTDNESTDRQTTKFAGMAQSEQHAITTLEGIGRKIAEGGK